MWLINAQTIALEQVFSSEGDSHPKYSILSHRWGDDEVTFQDFHDLAVRQKKAGFEKIVRSCQQTLRDGLKYTWVDTCCINKDSHAELSESINSMYQWYEAAEICYAYLNDIPPGQEHSIGNSVWFTRGWTLQELVAPRKLIFFNSAWNQIGDRHTLQDAVTARTRIAADLLEGKRGVESFSIAERMSWASDRSTARAEDRAYCLIGIFQVSMAMLYGEGGERAFRRLQDEIIRQSDDHSIFAWSMAMEPGNQGLLAKSPSSFASAAKMQSVSVRSGRLPYSVTNRGVSITLSMTPWYMDTYLAIINCAPREPVSPPKDENDRVGIFLRRLYEDDAYVRVQFNGEEMIDLSKHVFQAARREPMEFRSVTVNVRQNALEPSHLPFLQLKRYGFRFSESLLNRHQKEAEHTKISRHRDTIWDTHERTLVKGYGPSNYSIFTGLDLSPAKKAIKAIRIFIDYDFNPVIFLAKSSALEEVVKILNKNGALNYGESSERQWTDKEREEFKAFYRRTIDDEFGWNKVYTRDGRTFAQPNQFRQGLWMLRGDRVFGLDIYLEGLGGKEALLGAHLVIKRGATAAGEIWDVDLTGLESTAVSLKKMFK